MAVVEVSLETGAVIAASAGVVGGLWGGMVSVRAATRGPQWALDHLRKALPIALMLLVIGGAFLLLVSPGWVGAALVYVFGLVAWMARSVARSLEKVREAGGFTPLSPGRQAVILSRTARWLLIGGGVIAAVAVYDFSWRGWPAVFDLVLAGALLLPGYRIRQQAAALSAEEGPPAVPGA